MQTKSDEFLAILMQCKKLEHIASGKVREIFRIKEFPDLLLVYVTDRWSAYDFVFGFQMEGFGIIRNLMTIHWKRRLLKEWGIRSDLVAWARYIDDYLPSYYSNNRELWRRVTIVRELDMIPVEVIHRCNVGGSLANAAKAARQADEAEFEFCGHILPATLRSGEEFQPALSTPTTKAKSGHDLNVDTHTVERDYPGLQDFGLDVITYIRHKLEAEGRGRILDWKGEFGRLGSTPGLVWGDEFSPDSARFCLEEDYAAFLAGEPIVPCDKEFGRLHMLSQHPELEPKKGMLNPGNPEDQALVASWRESDAFLSAFQDRYRKGFWINTGETPENYAKLALGIE
jgi:phosphoribosylaminoimidazole-succinocarboxamide synthase